MNQDDIKEVIQMSSLNEPKKKKKKVKFSKLGKLAKSIEKTKSLPVKDLQKNSFVKLAKAHGVDLQNPQKALKEMKVLKMFFEEHGIKKLNEIESLLDLANILRTDVAMRTMEKLTMGIPLDSEDRGTIKLLKETVEASHRLKHGTKVSHIHADLKDIRQMMMQ